MQEHQALPQAQGCWSASPPPQPNTAPSHSCVPDDRSLTWVQPGRRFLCTTNSSPAFQQSSSQAQLTQKPTPAGHQHLPSSLPDLVLLSLPLFLLTSSHEKQCPRLFPWGSSEELCARGYLTAPSSLMRWWHQAHPVTPPSPVPLPALY